tara:strand:- start:300 stop:500 length:201 start_codon:yes stop_codon:yes gene_type:complete
MKYIATMEFIGHHYIEFEAENDEEAKQIMEDKDVPHPFEPNEYASNVEECYAISMSQEDGENIWWV